MQAVSGIRWWDRRVRHRRPRGDRDRQWASCLRKPGLRAGCGDSSKYYSVLTRSTRQDGALQVTEIDRKGPIGHRLLTGPKQLELPGCGATIAAVSDISRCTEQEILDAVGFKMQQDLNSKAVKCKAGHQRLDAERTKTDLPKERKSRISASVFGKVIHAS